MNAWYAVYTYARMEKWARSNLWERGYEVYLPQYRKQLRHARKVDWISAPLFPRYLFVTADLELGERRGVVTAPGVVSMVAFGERPATLPQAAIDEIKAREDENGNVQLCDPRSLSVGDQVRLHDGALRDHVGLFEFKTDDERVVILLDLLGRQVRVRVSPGSISRVL